MIQQETTNAVSIKLLLESGAHFGHQTGRWHPRMKKYIFIQRSGIHILNLELTVSLLGKACDFITDTVANGGEILFVGTKKQAQEAIEQESRRCGMPFVNQRWIGGMLTNFAVIQSRIDYLVRLEDQKARGNFDRLPKKEAMKLAKSIQRLNRLMGGFKEMTKLPSAIFIIDPSKERTTIAEARRVGIPIVAVVDTNCNPDEVDYPIPANDDAVRAVKLVCSKIADAVMAGKGVLEKVEEESIGMKSEEEIVKTLGSLTFVPEKDGDNADSGNHDKGVEGKN